MKILDKRLFSAAPERRRRSFRLKAFFALEKRLLKEDMMEMDEIMNGMGKVDTVKKLSIEYSGPNKL